MTGFAVGALCAAIVHAAAQVAPVELPPVVVPAPSEPAEPAPADAAARRDPTGSVTVIDVADRPAQARDTAELLAAAPGVLVHDFGGLGQAKTISIRGASSTGVLVLLDGVPLAGAGGIAELSRVPLALASSLEVLRGGAGARYGPGGLGGVVNVRTADPRSLSMRATLEGGSFGTGLGELHVEAPVGRGYALLLLHGGTTRGDFQYLFDPTPQLPGNPVLQLQRQNNSAMWGGALAKYRAQLGGFAANALLEVSADRRGLAGTVDYPTSDALMDGRRLAASVRAERPVGQDAALSLRAFFRRDDSTFSGGYFNPPGQQRFVSSGASVDGSWVLGGAHALSGTVELGADALGEPTGSNPRWLKAAAMAMDEILLLGGRAVLAPSLRADVVGPFVTLSPKLGFTASLPWELQLRANAGQAHRAASFLELYVVQGTLLPNPSLRPERALYADLGLDRAFDRGSVSVGGFGSLYEDLISYEYYPPFLARAFNFAAAAVYGMESSAQLDRDWVQASAAYTLLFSKNLRDEPRYFGKELPYRPRHSLRAALTVGPRALQGRVEANLQSEQFANRTEDVVLSARALVNASLEAELPFARWCRAAFEVKNALDARAEDVDGYPLPGRAFYLGLKVQLAGAKHSGSEPKG